MIVGQNKRGRKNFSTQCRNQNEHLRKKERPVPMHLNTNKWYTNRAFPMVGSVDVLRVRVQGDMFNLHVERLALWLAQRARDEPQRATERT
eukprot:COSAG02_NODE_7985_length_2757_cov_2.605342_2_plen_91_part_00